MGGSRPWGPRLQFQPCQTPNAEAVSRIRIPGSQVIPVPLFRVLDGKTPSDYVQRVEPSPSGGCKMAEFLLDMMDHHPGRTSSAEPLAPASSYIQRG